MTVLTTRTRLHAMVGPAVVAAGAACACAFISFANPTVPGGILPVCPTKALFGIDCPGCGSLRMIYSVTHLDFPAALHYNALAFVAFIALSVSFVVWTVGRWRRTEPKQWYQLRWAPHIVLGLVLVWFVIRNLPFAPFSSLYV